MIARELISDEIPPLKTSDTGDKAREWMQEFMVKQLPIVNNKQLLGLVQEEDIIDLSKPEEALGNHQLSLLNPDMGENTHFYDIVRAIVNLKLSLVPVVDQDRNYLGSITIHDILNAFSRISSIGDTGGILVLQVSQNDYSLAEIARIVEEENARILSSYIFTEPNTTEMEINLKINASDLSTIEATFERFEYIVKGSYQQPGYYDDLKDHYESLMNFLNV
ncbi:MAG: CBS domain-containing protein [Bacteroidetes bacterium SW_11_45_7]|nr:MAG: CBS domain-containing protein [Bacteroidetes bacterium SW_11_45_7]